MYADKETSAMKAAIEETARRRKQNEYNKNTALSPRP